MKIGVAAAAAIVSGVLLSSSTFVAADAADTEPQSIVVKKVVRKPHSKARAYLKLTCPRGATYSLVTEILQDKTPDAAPLDAYYTVHSVREGTCTGRAKRMRVTTWADTSGAFSPTDGRLRRGQVEVVLSLTVADEFSIVSSYAKVR